MLLGDRPRTLEYFGTLTVGKVPAETLEQRLTRCYELAGYAIALGTVPEGTVLVHGTMHARSRNAQRIGHAWLELPDETVWEPILREIWWADIWEVFARPASQRRYTRDQTRSAIIRWQHWGPWEDGE